MNAAEILSVVPNSRLMDLGSGEGRKSILQLSKDLALTASGHHVGFIGPDSWAGPWDERQGMPYVNRCADMCQQYGLVGIWPFPDRRWWGRGWCAPGGALRFDKGRADLDFFAALIDTVRREIGPIDFIMGGFGDAGLFCRLFDCLMPGLLIGHVSVNGTCRATSPRPRPGSGVMVCHGLDNQFFPPRGGIGKSLIAQARCRLLGKCAWESRPDLQVLDYAEVNGVLGEKVQEHQAGYIRTQYGKNPDCPIVEYQVVGGKHSWYGRRRGEEGGMNMESSRSLGNTGNAPPDFSVCDAIAKEFRFAQLTR